MFLCWAFITACTDATAHQTMDFFDTLGSLDSKGSAFEKAVSNLHCFVPELLRQKFQVVERSYLCIDIEEGPQHADAFGFWVSQNQTLVIIDNDIMVARSEEGELQMGTAVMWSRLPSQFQNITCVAVLDQNDHNSLEIGIFDFLQRNTDPIRDAEERCQHLMTLYRTNELLTWYLSSTPVDELLRKGGRQLQFPREWIPYIPNECAQSFVLPHSLPAINSSEVDSEYCFIVDDTGQTWLPDTGRMFAPPDHMCNFVYHLVPARYHDCPPHLWGQNPRFVQIPTNHETTFF